MTRPDDVQAATPGAQAVLTAASSIAVMGMGAIVALFVLLVYGAGARTDAMFTAYGAYAAIVAVAQGLRLVLVARLLPHLGWHPVHRLMTAVCLLSLVTAFPMLLAAGPLAELVVGELGDEAVDIAAVSLRLLWFAGSLQLLSGLLAAALAAREDLSCAAWAYASGALLTIAALPALAPAFGIVAVPAALVLGAVFTCGRLWLGLRRTSWSPRLERPGLKELLNLGAGCVGSVILQVAYLASLACAARLGPGAVTAYSYGFFAAILLLGATSGPASLVLAGSLARTWDRRPASLEPQLLTVVQTTLVLVAPLLVVTAIVGDELLSAAIPGPQAAALAGDVVMVLLALTGFIAATAAASLVTIACYAAERYSGVAVVSALVLLIHVAATALALRADTIVALAVAQSGSSVLLLFGLLLLIGTAWAFRAVSLVAVTAVRVAVFAVVAFLPAVVAASTDTSWPVHAAALLVSLSVYALVARFAAPRADRLLRQVREERRARRTRRPDLLTISLDAPRD